MLVPLLVIVPPLALPMPPEPVALIVPPAISDRTGVADGERAARCFQAAGSDGNRSAAGDGNAAVRSEGTSSQHRDLSCRSGQIDSRRAGSGRGDRERGAAVIVSVVSPAVVPVIVKELMVALAVRVGWFVVVVGIVTAVVRPGSLEGYCSNCCRCSTWCLCRRSKSRWLGRGEEEVGANVLSLVNRRRCRTA